MEILAISQVGIFRWHLKLEWREQKKSAQTFFQRGNFWIKPVLPNLITLRNEIVELLPNFSIWAFQYLENAAQSDIDQTIVPLCYIECAINSGRWIAEKNKTRIDSLVMRQPYLHLIVVKHLSLILSSGSNESFKPLKTYWCYLRKPLSFEAKISSKCTLDNS